VCEQVVDDCYVIMKYPGVEPTTSGSLVQYSKHYTTRMPTPKSSPPALIYIMTASLFAQVVTVISYDISVDQFHLAVIGDAM